MAVIPIELKGVQAIRNRVKELQEVFDLYPLNMTLGSRCSAT